MKRYNIHFGEQDEVDIDNVEFEQGFDKILSAKRTATIRKKAIRRLFVTIIFLITPMVITLGFMNRNVIIKLFTKEVPKKAEVQELSLHTDIKAERPPEIKEARPIKQEKIIEPYTPKKIQPELKLDELKVERKKDLIVNATPTVGFDSLKKYFDQAIVFNQNEMGMDSVREAMVLFWVNKKGRPEEIRIMEKLDDALQAKVIRSIKAMPTWSPSTINGDPYRSLVGLRIIFKMEKGD